MWFKFLSFFCLFSFTVKTTDAQTVSGPRGEQFTARVVAQGLSDPWEITYGPDNFLWVTEAKGYRVNRINPENGTITTLLDLSKEKNFPRYDKMPEEASGGKPWPQGGLMGLALHPQLLTGKPYVYLVYVYDFDGAAAEGDGCAPNYGGCVFTTKLVRYEYNARQQTLSKPLVLTDTIPGSDDHNAGRLLVAPVDGKDYLFYTVGDMGAGQFDNAGRENFAQRTDKYEGKVLRFNLEPDNDTSTYDKWIPGDNPFNAARQSAVWSYGHRNAQGLAYAVVGNTGNLYTAEHGPFGDDEINIIRKGKNYGHPLVIGYNDGNYNGLAAGVTAHSSLPGKWNTMYPYIETEEANVKAIGTENYQGPVHSFYPTSNTFLRSVLTRARQDEEEKPEWPALAPSSIAVYTASAIPGWQNSLLITSLTEGRLVRLKLNTTGSGLTGDTLTYFKAPARYRDIAISPDGRSIYLAIDSAEVSSGPSEEKEDDGDSQEQQSQCSGCIIAYTYQADANTMNQESLVQELRNRVQRMNRKKQRAVRAKLAPAQKAAFQLLLKPELTEKEKAQVQQYASGLLEVVKQVE
ncbi:hypothetical protein DXT99_08615 [Pontibacter diazotrophicus]|uniref:Glucose/Sorbosone dehydrogenase domain-containing protein n=1 Tax=Pontibacter diazotrophicus TaxID=1400979 RepID=A0A3D8LDM5_9BACT|nr:PQQ-dependent sugar dehydrogenase [Pontibacter diazotrophicus]RDV15541.1 hypothetical protein DXT99_08615 [Pontibacter diazotrophicus]